MSVSITEVVLLLGIMFGALLVTVVGKNWFYLGMVPLFVIAMLVTPADPLSCLLVGLPAILIYAFTVRRMQSGDPGADN
jgi:Sec-independent protein secretion pathway component TatC